MAMPPGSDGAPLLQVEGLDVEFRLPAGGVRPALRQASLTIDRGEILAVVGESGSGKSLLCLSLLGLLPEQARVASGSIRFDGIELTAAGAAGLRAMRGRKIAMVFQDAAAALSPVHSIGTQMRDALRACLPLTRRQAAARARELLEAVRIQDPKRVLRSYPHQLSGGMCQRIGIAMALAGGPALLIADEPTTAIDAVTRRDIVELLREVCRERGMALLFVSHDLGTVSFVAERTVVMRSGEVVETGATAQLVRSPAHPYTRKLLDAVPRLHGPRGQFDAEPRETATPCAGPADTLLALEGVSHAYADRARDRDATLVLKDVTISVAAGEVLGVIGESGSGKSTMSLILAGLLAPTSGRVLLDGAPVVAGKTPRKAFARRVQMVFQDPLASFNPLQRLGRALEEPARIHGIGSARARRDRAIALLDMVGLGAEYADRFPHQVSGGQRQRVGIARALALEPSVVILDEPTSALDVSIQADILKLLAALKRERPDRGFVFVSHDLAVVRQICDRVAVIERGRVVEAGTSERIFACPQSEYARTLIDSVFPDPAGVGPTGRHA